jgi:hypothetical protein
MIINATVFDHDPTRFNNFSKGGWSTGRGDINPLDLPLPPIPAAAAAAADTGVPSVEPGPA